MKLSIFFVILIVKVLHADSSNQIACGIIKDQMEFSAIGSQRTCFVGADTIVDRRDYTFSIEKDETVKALVFGKNPKLQYLPIRVNENLPKLLTYTSNGSPIKFIARENFKNMKDLKVLSIVDGKIEKVYSDSFEDLTSLEQIDLRNNKIKLMNAEQLFDGLDRLKLIQFKGNDCIDENFTNREGVVAWLITSDTDRCGFCRSDRLIEVMICEMAHQTRDNTQYLTEIAGPKQGQNINEQLLRKIKQCPTPLLPSRRY